MDLQPIEIPIGACRCPGTPHTDGDVVYLAPELSMLGGMAAQGAIAMSGTDPIALQEALGTVWIRHAVIDWNLIDEDGDKLALTQDNITRSLPYARGGRVVAERADDLYHEAILAPLEERVAKLSKRGPKDDSTSRTKASPRKRQSPSSTATTAEAHPGG